MNGRRREQFTGIYPGPYMIGDPTKADIPVLAAGPEGSVCVGRFPVTKVMDGEAQAKAYAQLPAVIELLKAISRYDWPGSHDAWSILKDMGIES